MKKRLAVLLILLLCLPALAQAVGAARYRLPQAPYAMCKWLTACPAGWENILLGFDFA
mgnify:CR=1 FL=1